MIYFPFLYVPFTLTQDNGREEHKTLKEIKMCKITPVSKEHILAKKSPSLCHLVLFFITTFSFCFCQHVPLKEFIYSLKAFMYFWFMAFNLRLKVLSFNLNDMMYRRKNKQIGFC